MMPFHYKAFRLEGNFKPNSLVAGMTSNQNWKVGIFAHLSAREHRVNLNWVT